MELRKKPFLIGLFYIFISIFETAASVLPWIKYCEIEFSFLSTYTIEHGLSYNQSKFRYYGGLEKNLCGYFKPVVENLCPEFCINIRYVQNAGLLLLSCNIVFIIMHVFFAYVFISKSKQRIDGEIAGLACWTMAMAKVLLGIVYFEVAGPKSFKTPLRYSFDVFLSFGFYFYVFGALSEILVAYFIYNFETYEIRQQSKSIIGS